MVRKKFTNPHIRDIRRTPWDFLLWKIGYYNDKRIKREPPQDFSYPQKKPDLKLPYAQWIGHSTFLVKNATYAFLTDPLWSKYCAPLPMQTLKRRHPTPMPITKLPKIDFILISHNHYDHLDAKSVKAIKKRFPKAKWVVPSGLKAWFEKRGFQHVYELGWGEEKRIFDDVKITAVPAQHFSGRGIFDTNKTLWNGYIVEMDDKTLYFCGDTGYNDIDFKQIGKKWKKIDLSFIPIGTYTPRKFMKPVHISPLEAVKIHRDVKSKQSIGMHWKTFRLSDEPMNLPPYDLYQAMKKKHLSPSRFLAVEPGDCVNW